MNKLHSHLISLYLLCSVITFVSLLGCKEDEDTSIFHKYDPLIWQAMLEYREGNFRQSLDLFSEAFEIIPDDLENHHFHAAAAALELGEMEYAEKNHNRCNSKY